MSKLFDHLVTKHDKKPLSYPNLGWERVFWTRIEGLDEVNNRQTPLKKVNSDLEFIINWKSYDANATMFWISYCGTPKEAKEYEYTIKIKSSAENKAGRTKVLLMGTGECLSCEVSHEDVKRRPKVMLFSNDILKEAAEGNDENDFEWRLVIQKK